MQDIVTYKGSLYFKEGEDAKPKALPGSCIAFTKNGELQGTAFRSAAAVPHIPASTPSAFSRIQVFSSDTVCSCATEAGG